jgi:hypothetical protein
MTDGTDKHIWARKMFLAYAKAHRNLKTGPSHKYFKAYNAKTALSEDFSDS